VGSCINHPTYFNEECEECKKEYFSLKGLEIKENLIITYSDIPNSKEKPVVYKEFNEEKAKQLYEKLFIYYFKNTGDEKEASKKAKSVIKKQCIIRNFTPWKWV
jgi:hypothetical protein